MCPFPSTYLCNDLRQGVMWGNDRRTNTLFLPWDPNQAFLEGPFPHYIHAHTHAHTYTHTLHVQGTTTPPPNIHFPWPCRDRSKWEVHIKNFCCIREYHGGLEEKHLCSCLSHENNDLSWTTIFTWKNEWQANCTLDTQRCFLENVLSELSFQGK